MANQEQTAFIVNLLDNITPENINQGCFIGGADRKQVNKLFGSVEDFRTSVLNFLQTNQDPYLITKLLTLKWDFLGRGRDQGLVNHYFKPAIEMAKQEQTAFIVNLLDNLTPENINQGCFIGGADRDQAIKLFGRVEAFRTSVLNFLQSKPVDPYLITTLITLKWDFLCRGQKGMITHFLKPAIANDPLVTIPLLDNFIFHGIPVDNITDVIFDNRYISNLLYDIGTNFTFEVLLRIFEYHRDEYNSPWCFLDLTVLDYVIYQNGYTPHQRIALLESFIAMLDRNQIKLFKKAPENARHLIDPSLRYRETLTPREIELIESIIN